MWVRCDWEFICDCASSSGRLLSGGPGGRGGLGGAFCVGVCVSVRVCENHSTEVFPNHHTVYGYEEAKIDCGERLFKTEASFMTLLHIFVNISAARWF